MGHRPVDLEMPRRAAKFGVAGQCHVAEHKIKAGTWHGHGLRLEFLSWDLLREKSCFCYQIPEDGIREWLLRTTGSGRLFDLCAHALAHYFHPAMGGSTSIKAVLPAIWGSNESLRADRWFKAYARTENGKPIDPYQTLPKLEIFDRTEVVNEGTGAMWAYQEMLYGEGRRDATAQKVWRDLLLQYCHLDTLAMVIIWKHWTS